MENEELKNSQQIPDERAGMDKGHHYEYKMQQHHSHNKGLGGLFIVLIGIALLLKQIPGIAVYLPDWLYTWPMILIIVGAFIFLKNGFGGIAPIIIGIFFLLRNEDMLNSQIKNYAFPIFIILIGLVFILKRNHQDRCRHRRRRQGLRHGEKYSDNSSEDFIDINSVFGSAEKSMFTKTFKGGTINCAFGGGKINLIQADIEDKAVLNISVAFGGAEIRVPANWQIQNDLTAILGGIEDKRRLTAPSEDTKTLILRGGIFCGGVEIRN